MPHDFLNKNKSNQDRIMIYLCLLGLLIRYFGNISCLSLDFQHGFLPYTKDPFKSTRDLFRLDHRIKSPCWGGPSNSNGDRKGGFLKYPSWWQRKFMSLLWLGRLGEVHLFSVTRWWQRKTYLLFSTIPGEKTIQFDLYDIFSKWVETIN